MDFIVCACIVRAFTRNIRHTHGGNANLSQQILNNNYASVAEQSGIKAGSGGYSIIKAQVPNK